MNICEFCNRKFIQNKGCKRFCSIRCKNTVLSRHGAKKRKEDVNYCSWNKGKTKETDERVRKNGAATLGRKKSKEHKQKISASVSNNIVNKQIKTNSYYKHGSYFSKLNNKEFWYRSSYELEAYKLLDNEDMQNIIKSWDVECLRISYIDENNQIRNTIPDILIEYKSGKKQLIDIKPSCRLNEKINILRHKACEKYCKENNIIYSIWTEKELGI